MGTVKIKGKVNVNTIDGIYKWTEEEYDKLYNSIEPWVRPADWIDVPEITSSETVMYGVFGVLDTIPDNVVALTTTTTGGFFTVDWGDGSAVETFASLVKAEHNYDYATCGGVDTENDGRQVLVKVIPSGATLSYVNLAQKPTGYVQDILVNWVEIKINGPDITDINMVNTECINMVKNIWVGENKVTTLGSSAFDGCAYCENLWLDSSTWTSFFRTFRNMYSLTNIYLTDTSNVTNWSTSFYGNIAIKAYPRMDMSKATTCQSCFTINSAVELFPPLDFSNASTVTSMFSSCQLLRAIQHFDTSNHISMGTFCSSCYNLTYMPHFDTSNATNMTGFFQNLYNVTTIPFLDTSKNTKFAWFFNNNRATEVPLLDTSKGTDFTAMFENSFVETIPQFDTSEGLNFKEFFRGCNFLREIPLLDTSKGTDFSYMFYLNYTHLDIPLFDTSNATTVKYMFANCQRINDIPLFDLSNVTDVSYMFSSNSGIRSLPALDFSNVGTGTQTSFLLNTIKLVWSDIRNVSFTHSYNNNSLTAEALDNIYTNLPTVTGGQTITVTNNPGVGGDDPSIATSKGWTVNG